MIDIVAFVKKSIVDRVVAIREGLGKTPSPKAIERYRSLWQKDPLAANAWLFFFELQLNSVPFPAGALDGPLDLAVDKMTALSIVVRFGSEEALGDWQLGIYGYPTPLTERQVN